MSDWQIGTVESLCSKVTSGGTPRRNRPDFFTGPQDGSTPWVKTQELRDTVIWETEEWITEEAITNSSAKVLPTGTVLMAMYGATVGRLARLGRPMTCNQASCAMIVDPTKGDERFLFYRLMHDRAALVNLANGAAQQNLSGGIIKAFSFPVPPLDEQRRIADVLASLDNLVEHNESLARTADELALAVWRSIVLDECHEQARLGNQATVVLGGTPSRMTASFWGGDIPWLNSGEANKFRVLTGSEGITQEGYKRSSTKLMPAGTTLIAITGTTLGQVTRTEIEACGNQSLVGVYAPEDAVLNDHLYLSVVDRMTELLTHATGGAQQHVNKGNVESLTISVLSDEARARVAAEVSPLLAFVGPLLVEAGEARLTRDELLPLLMSGQVRVRDDEGLVA